MANIANITTRHSYIGIANQIAIIFTFPVLSEHVVSLYINNVLISPSLYHIVLSPSTGGSILLNTPSTGGTIVLNTPLVGGESIIVIRDTNINRLAYFTDGGAYNTADLDKEIYQLYLILQEIAGRLNRTLTWPLSFADAPILNITHNNAALMINADGTQIVTTPIASIAEIEQYAQNALATINQAIADVLDTHDVQGTTSTRGHFLAATNQEAISGTIADKVVTPVALKAALDAFAAFKNVDATMLTGNYNGLTSIVLPLPDGFVEEECQFFSMAASFRTPSEQYQAVSVDRLSAQAKTGDSSEGYSSLYGIYFVFGRKSG